MSTYTDEHKMPAYEIHRMSNADASFYEVVSRFLAKRDIAGELGAPVWDDPGKIWYIAVSQGEAIGMIAYWRKTVCSFWVAPRTRGQAVGYALLRRLMLDAPDGETLTATATEESLRLFEAVGFVDVSKRGRYHICRYTPPQPPWVEDVLA